MKTLALVVLTLVLAGCGSAPYLAHYGETDVLYTTPEEVNRLCQLAPVPHKPAVIGGCYVPALRLAVVPHGDDGSVLAHELRHAREGAFHQ